MDQASGPGTSDRFSRWSFLIAAGYGFLALLPQYFMEAELGRRFPPPFNHPEQFYGFLGVALAWQVAFLIIASDVRRYRLIMIPAILEKLGFGLAAVVLFAMDRVGPPVLGAGAVDLVFAVLFAVAFIRTRGDG
jgi:hypothetical protein